MDFFFVVCFSGFFCVGFFLFGLRIFWVDFFGGFGLGDDDVFVCWLLRILLCLVEDVDVKLLLLKVVFNFWMDNYIFVVNRDLLWLV